MQKNPTCRGGWKKTMAKNPIEKILVGKNLKFFSLAVLKFPACWPQSFNKGSPPLGKKMPLPTLPFFFLGNFRLGTSLKFKFFGGKKTQIKKKKNTFKPAIKPKIVPQRAAPPFKFFWKKPT